MKGSENDLTILEEEWVKVQNQTLWSLQDYYNIMSPNANQSQNLDHTQAHVPQPLQSSETPAVDVAQPAENPLRIADSSVAPSDPTSSSFSDATALWLLMPPLILL